MAKIGVEYIEHFPHLRATGAFDGADDLVTPYYIAEWFVPRLVQAGHTAPIFRRDQAAEEKDLRDVSQGGADSTNADSVDLFFIITHGRYDNHETHLAFDIQKDDWVGSSGKWKFGENCNLEWLMIYGCHTIDSDNVLDHHHIFTGLHLICGAYSWMYDSWTCCEVGADTAENLASGKTVCASWIDGVSDWWAENHPMVISVEKNDTWRNGNPDWPSTVIGSDHLWGHGTTRADIPPSQQHWMAAIWSDSGVWDYG